MAIFNEAYINEFFGIGKKKNAESKARDILTKEEISECKDIIKESCKKNKFISNIIKFENGENYNKYLKSNSDSMCIAWIYHSSGDKLWNDSDDGEKVRKDKNLNTDYEEFIDWYYDELYDIEKDIKEKISKRFENKIKFDTSTSDGDYDYFYIESKKSKEGDI